MPRSESDLSEYLYAISGGIGERPQEKFKLTGEEICVLIDSGSPYNMIDETTYEQLDKSQINLTKQRQTVCLRCRIILKNDRRTRNHNLG